MYLPCPAVQLCDIIWSSSLYLLSLCLYISSSGYGSITHLTLNIYTIILYVFTLRIDRK